MSDVRCLTVKYRNYRGEVAERYISPRRIWFGVTDWHPEPGWLLTVYDVEKGALRDYALADCDFRRADAATIERLTADLATIERLTADLAASRARVAELAEALRGLLNDGNTYARVKSADAALAGTAAQEEK